MATGERGTVVSIVPSWHPGQPGGDRPLSRRLQLLVEYDTDDGPTVVRAVTTEQPGLDVGSEVWLLRQSGGRFSVRFDAPVRQPWWVGQPRSGLLAYAAFVVILLIIGGGILAYSNARSDQIMPRVPPSISPGASMPPSSSLTPSVSPSPRPVHVE